MLYKGIHCGFIEVLQCNFTLIKDIVCLQMNSGPTTSRLDIEWARKRTKRARETVIEKGDKQK